MADESEYEYGFADSGDTERTIWWYVFGMPHKTEASARRTASKNVWGEAIIYRRKIGSVEHEEVSDGRE